MKTTILSATVLLVGMAFGLSASAAPPIGLPVKDPVTPTYGHFEARVKQIRPHAGPDGRYYTWEFHTITANMMMYCQTQLATWMSSANVSLVEDCHQVP